MKTLRKIITPLIVTGMVALGSCNNKETDNYDHIFEPKTLEDSVAWSSYNLYDAHYNSTLYSDSVKSYRNSEDFVDDENYTSMLVKLGKLTAKRDSLYEISVSIEKRYKAQREKKK